MLNRNALKLQIITLLLVTSVMLSYMDRGNLSVAAPLLQDEMQISVSKLGSLLSAFFWTYAVFQLVSGWLVDRFDKSWVMAGGFLLWSSATAASGLVRSYGVLLAFRLVLGIGESVAFPVYSKILASQYTERRRGVANAAIDIGSKAGPCLATLFGGFFMVRMGWRPFFVLLGLVGVPWLACWLKWKPQPTPAESVRGSDSPELTEILMQRGLWASATGLFCSSYFWYFLLTWLPYYLVRERNFSTARMSVVGALPFLFSIGGTSLAAAWSYRAIGRGSTPTRVRKLCTGGGMAGTAVILAVPAVHSDLAAMAILMTASLSYGIYCSSHWTMTQTLAGPAAAGRWTGVVNFISNLAGIVAPIVTGRIAEQNGHFFWAFFTTAAVGVIGSLIYFFGFQKIEPVPWRRITSQNS